MPKYKTHNDVSDDESIEWWDGTHLQGYVDTTYDALVAAFGKPTTSDEYKVDWEWLVEFDDGTIATVYNWKDGPNYCGSEGLKASQITDWQIGGKEQRSVDLIGQVLSAPTETEESRHTEWLKQYKLGATDV
tara:strand:- start:66 stop:461 length:396 start_codon:yes stop_codon:yes gene_type:complete